MLVPWRTKTMQAFLKRMLVCDSGTPSDPASAGVPVRSWVRSHDAHQESQLSDRRWVLGAGGFVIAAGVALVATGIVVLFCDNQLDQVTTAAVASVFATLGISALVVSFVVVMRAETRAVADDAIIGMTHRAFDAQLDLLGWSPNTDDVESRLDVARELRAAAVAATLAVYRDAKGGPGEHGVS